MLTRPADLSDDDVRAAVESGWGIDAGGIEHVPRGFGSHHWRVAERWFISLDDRSASTHEPALRTARWLLDEAGLSFVVAPVPSLAGEVVEWIGDRWAVAVYPWVDGQPHDWGPYPDAASRDAVAALLDQLHAVAPPAGVPVDDFALPPMPDESAWTDAGPFSGPARAALADSAGVLTGALRHYATLVEAARDEPFVITHGEPHVGNTVDTADGVVLIDWESLRLAPAERDRWHVDGTEGLYSLRWALTDIALYAADLQRPHERTPDSAVAWAGFTGSLESIHRLLPTIRRPWASP